MDSTDKDLKYSIREASRILGIQANALRFYEKKGLSSPRRGENGYREYSWEDIARLKVVMVYRGMGFSVSVIRKLLAGAEGEDDILKLFGDQYQLLNSRIHTMTAIRSSLEVCVEGMLDHTLTRKNMMKELETTARYTALAGSWEDEWHFDQWAERYDSDIRDFRGGINFYEHYDRVMEETARAVNRAGFFTVEIGIGTGNLAREILSRRKQEYLGIDQSLAMLRQARKKLPQVPVRLGTFLQLPVGDGCCDTVVCSYAFHHLSHEEKALACREMRRILRPGGRIIIADLMFETQEKRELFLRTATGRERETLEDEYFGNVEELGAMLEGLGFSWQAEPLDRLVWLLTASRRTACNGC